MSKKSIDEVLKKIEDNIRQDHHKKSKLDVEIYLKKGISRKAVEC